MSRIAKLVQALKDAEKSLAKTFKKQAKKAGL
jgi:hypothetical protein